MARPCCRFCGEGGRLRPVRPEGGLGVAGARARRMARVPVWEHPSCLERWTAAHAAGEARRSELYQQAAAAARAGDADRALALMDEAVDVLDSQFLPPTP